MRPLILISNDDGYHSKGLASLVDMVRDMADLLVCAPESARSGFSCAFSAMDYLTLKRRNRWGDGVTLYSCSGTPVDCVKIGLDRLCPRRPDLILSGINHGDNASVNTHYSGTMGVVMEGAMKYIPSIAYSLASYAEDADFEPCRKLIRAITQKVLSEGLPEGVCLNVNFPNTKEFKGVRPARMARGTWANEVMACQHPRGFEYYWMTGNYINDEPEADDTDNWGINHGYVTITPTRVDVTHYEMLDKLKDWDEILSDCR